MHTLIQADARRIPLPDKSVHCVVTSPPYLGLRDYGVAGQIGLEETPEAFVETMRSVFAEVWRVLRDDGTLWMNLGDSYNAYNGGAGPSSSLSQTQSRERPQLSTGYGLKVKTLKPKDLMGIPWRVALALQSDGWYLRSDIIWCLSGGTWVYVRTQKGDMPMMIKDMARLDPLTLQLWNGEKWTRVLGMSRSERKADELEIVLRSGERISCTPGHQFPTSRGLLKAEEIKPGDILVGTTLPEPACPRDCAIDEDAAWFAGLYLAEGCKSNGKLAIAGHTKEVQRWERVKAIAKKYGGSATLRCNGNRQTITVSGKILVAIVDELVSGDYAINKGISPTAWRYSNKFLAAYIDGYLSGDGHWDPKNERWRLGFARNYNLERDIRTACARLGYSLTLKPSTVAYKGRQVPTFRGELRKKTGDHHNCKSRLEVVAIRNSRCRYVYDIGVEDEPHLYALASGVLTHNSKKSPMPESVTDRPTKAHEYLFLLAKQERYFYDAEAVKEPMASGPSDIKKMTEQKERIGGLVKTQVDPLMKASALTNIGQKRSVGDPESGRNLRSVWTIGHDPYPGAHFATFPRKLVEPCIKAGTSEKGCCPSCGSPWRRLTERSALKRERPNDYVKRSGEDGTGNSCGNTVAGVSVRTLGWEPTCGCQEHTPIPCTVFDPFNGSGTSGVVALALGRRYVGTDLNRDYLGLARRRIERPHAPVERPTEDIPLPLFNL